MDNSLAGLDWKIHPLKSIQLYGQLLLDEFNLSEIRSGKQWWANKWGYQLGAHYINVGLGANFSEIISILRYQPLPRLRIESKLVAYRQGRDSSARSFGSNIFLPNVSPYRVGDYGYAIGRGRDTRVLYASLFASYEFARSLFVDLQAGFRNEKSMTFPLSDQRTNWFSLGIRWNRMRREVDY